MSSSIFVFILWMGVECWSISIINKNVNANCSMDRWNCITGIEKWKRSEIEISFCWNAFDCLSPHVIVGIVSMIQWIIMQVAEEWLIHGKHIWFLCRLYSDMYPINNNSYSRNLWNEIFLQRMWISTHKFECILSGSESNILCSLKVVKTVRLNASKNMKWNSDRNLIISFESTIPAYVCNNALILHIVDRRLAIFRGILFNFKGKINGNRFYYYFLCALASIC